MNTTHVNCNWLVKQDKMYFFLLISKNFHNVIQEQLESNLYCNNEYTCGEVVRWGGVVQRRAGKALFWHEVSSILGTTYYARE